MRDNISQITGLTRGSPPQAGQTLVQHERLGPASGDFKMAMEPEGWFMDLGPPSWNPEAKAFSFFLRKLGREPVMCILAMDALENAAQSSDLSEPALSRIFDAHRLMIELRAAQKLNAGLLDDDGRVLLAADDLGRRTDAAQPCSGT
jgi:hypothetical protein